MVIVECTACSHSINLEKHKKLRIHPEFKVVICKKCWDFLKSGEISKDEDGFDEQCRWCGDGGELLGCDYCTKSICQNCIRRNFSSDILESIMDETATWQCYGCNPEPLARLMTEAKELLEYMKDKEEEEVDGKTRTKAEEKTKSNKIVESSEDEKLTNRHGKKNTNKKPDSEDDSDDDGRKFRKTPKRDSMKGRDNKNDVGKSQKKSKTKKGGDSDTESEDSDDDDSDDDGRKFRKTPKRDSKKGRYNKNDGDDDDSDDDGRKFRKMPKRDSKKGTDYKDDDDDDDDDDVKISKKSSKKKTIVESDDDVKNATNSSKKSEKRAKKDSKTKIANDSDDAVDGYKKSKKKKAEDSDEDSDDFRKLKKNTKKRKAEDSDSDEKSKKITKKRKLDESAKKKKCKKNTSEDSDNDLNEDNHRKNNVKQKRKIYDESDEESSSPSPSMRGKKRYTNVDDESDIESEEECLSKLATSSKAKSNKPGKKKEEQKQEEKQRKEKRGRNLQEVKYDDFLKEEVKISKKSESKSKSKRLSKGTPTTPASTSQRQKVQNGSKLSAICTACGTNINIGKQIAFLHQDLDVVICQVCNDFLNSGDITKDEDGLDEQCSWCGEGGNLLGCDFCDRVFCQSCIQRNFGKKQLKQLLDADEDVKWKCYVCDCSPLQKLVQQSKELFQKIAEMEKQKQKNESSAKNKNTKVISSDCFDFNVKPIAIGEKATKLLAATKSLQSVIECVSERVLSDGENSNSKDEKDRSTTIGKALSLFFKSVKEIISTEPKQKLDSVCSEKKTVAIEMDTPKEVKKKEIQDETMDTPKEFKKKEIQDEKSDLVVSDISDFSDMEESDRKKIDDFIKDDSTWCQVFGDEKEVKENESTEKKGKEDMKETEDQEDMNMNNEEEKMEITDKEKETDDKEKEEEILESQKKENSDTNKEDEASEKVNDEAGVESPTQEKEEESPTQEKEEEEEDDNEPIYKVIDETGDAISENGRNENGEEENGCDRNGYSEKRMREDRETDEPDRKKTKEDSGSEEVL